MISWYLINAVPSMLSSVQFVIFVKVFSFLSNVRLAELYLRLKDAVSGSLLSITLGKKVEMIPQIQDTTTAEYTAMLAKRHQYSLQHLPLVIIKFLGRGATILSEVWV